MASVQPIVAGMHMFWPIRGLIDLVVRPSLWRAAIGASLLANLIIIAVAIGALIWYWPYSAEKGFDLRQLGHWGMLVSGTLVLVVPLIRGRAGRAVITPFLIELGRPADSEISKRGWMAAVGVLLRSLALRILWILAAIGGAVLHPVVGVAVGAIGIGHLTVLDALDQALMACNCDGPTRAQLRGPLFGRPLAAGVVAGLLFILAAASVFGPLIWMPAMFIGASRLAHQLVPVPASAPSPASAGLAGAGAASQPES